jgi:hypothetical protein
VQGRGRREEGRRHQSMAALIPGSYAGARRTPRLTRRDSPSLSLSVTRERPCSMFLSLSPSNLSIPHSFLPRGDSEVRVEGKARSGYSSPVAGADRRRRRTAPASREKGKKRQPRKSERRGPGQPHHHHVRSERVRSRHHPTPRVRIPARLVCSGAPERGGGERR